MTARTISIRMVGAPNIHRPALAAIVKLTLYGRDDKGNFVTVVVDVPADMAAAMAQRIGAIA